MKIRNHKDLDVYKLAFKCAISIYEISKSFPVEEKYSLTDQIRRSSRSIASNIAEAFRKRRYPKAFVAKLSDSEGEAAETQVWLEFCLQCGYMKSEIVSKLDSDYNHIIGMLVNMGRNPEKWSV